MFIYSFLKTVAGKTGEIVHRMILRLWLYQTRSCLATNPNITTAQSMSQSLRGNNENQKVFEQSNINALFK